MRLFKYISVIILISLALAAVTTIIINKGLRRSSIDFYGKINTVNNPETGINILFVGSSRTLTNINPAIIDSITHLKSYNAGLNAATVKTSYNIIASAAQNQPQLTTIVLNIDFSMLYPEADPYKDPYYYAYTSENKNILLTDNSKSNKIHRIKIFDITAYDDYVIYASLRGLLNNADFNNNGFVPHSEPGFSIDTSVIPKGLQPFSKNGKAIFNNIIALCKQKNISLIMVIAPYVRQYAPWLYISNYNKIIDEVKNTATKNLIPLFDYSSSDFGNDKSYFYNAWHLNIKGAKAYSIRVGNDLRKCNN